MNTARYRRLIDAAAELAALPVWHYRGEAYAPGEWLEGLIYHESARGQVDAKRYEAHQDQPGRAGADDADTPGQDDGLFEDDKSYGLMQLMGYNARRLCGVAPGTRQDFSFLLLPMTNIAFGLRILTAELAATAGDIPRALARYNGGPTGEHLVPGPHGPQLRRQEYVELVAAATALVRVDRVRETA